MNTRHYFIDYLSSSVMAVIPMLHFLRRLTVPQGVSYRALGKDSNGTMVYHI